MSKSKEEPREGEYFKELKDIGPLTYTQITDKYKIFTDIFPTTTEILRMPPTEKDKDGKQIVFPKYISIRAYDPKNQDVQYLLFMVLLSEKFCLNSTEEQTKTALTAIVMEAEEEGLTTWPLVRFLTFDEH